MNKKYLSLVIPLYNEEVRFKENINEILNFLKENFKEYELILVNDGSNDNTLNIIKFYSEKNNKVKIISYNKNRGKGYALRRGILKSNGDYILISDIDLSTPLKDFFNFDKYIDKFDIVIGSRAMKNSNIKKYQNILKVFLGRGGNFLIKFILGLNLNDTQCGFKLFKKNIKKIFELSLIDGFGYDFEVLFLSNKFNFKIKEIGVSWVNDERSKVKFKDYFFTLNELIYVRFNSFFGRYK